MDIKLNLTFRWKVTIAGEYPQFQILSFIIEERVQEKIVGAFICGSKKHLVCGRVEHSHIYVDIDSSESFLRTASHVEFERESKMAGWAVGLDSFVAIIEDLFVARCLGHFQLIKRV